MHGWRARWRVSRVPKGGGARVFEFEISFTSIFGREPVGNALGDVFEIVVELSDPSL